MNNFPKIIIDKIYWYYCQNHRKSLQKIREEYHRFYKYKDSLNLLFRKSNWKI